MGVNGVDVFTAGMAHQRLADFLHDPCFHEPRIECVAKIMKAAVADARATSGSLPSGLDYADGLAFEREEQALLLAFSEKELVYAVGKGDFTPFATGSLRLAYKEQVAVEVDVFPPLIEELAPTHARINRRYNNDTEMGGRSSEQLLLLV